MRRQKIVVYVLYTQPKPIQFETIKKSWTSGKETFQPYLQDI
jgi:hypothetical protein